MSDDSPITAKVVEGRHEDITSILAWLKREHDEDGEGLWCNHNLISDSLDRPGDIWVIRRNGEAVAFQLGRYSAEILSVRKDCRKMGLGRALVEASVERAFSDEVNALSVQCQPKESLGFWERMGFIRYGDFEPHDDIKARRILPRAFALPLAPSPVGVIIRFYPESVTYGDPKDVPPIATHHATGVKANDGSILLGQRIIEPSHPGDEARDIVIKIEVDGVVRCLCKAKYANAQAVGVQYDSLGDTYFIDRVNPIEAKG